jgi:hypothetical protein
MEIKNYILTDFSINDWRTKKIDFESVKKQIEFCNEKEIFGQINLDNHKMKSYELICSNMSHKITNIKIDEVDTGIIITGDVEFLNTPNGIKAKKLMDSGFYIFGIEALGEMDYSEENNRFLKTKIIFVKIYTWNIIKNMNLIEIDNKLKNENNNNNC